MSDGYVIKIKEDDLQDDYSYEELKPSAPESIKFVIYVKEFKNLLSQENEITM